MQEICIIIPCFNEEKRLPVSDLISFYEENSHYYFCFVNDGSTDKTFDVLKSIQKDREERIKIVNFKKNIGKAEAIRNGFNESINWKSFKYIGFLDADLSTPLHELNNLNSFTNQDFDIIVGSRIKRMGATIERSAKRHYLGRIFSTIASIILDLPIYDTQCGAKLIKSDIIEHLFTDPFTSRWLFDIEIFARLKNKFGTSYVQKKIFEVPLYEWIEKGGSKIRLSYYFKVPFELLKIHFKYKKRKKQEKSRN